LTPSADHLVVVDRGKVAAEGRPESALSSSILAAVYGVKARVEHCSRGRLHIMVDGLADDATETESICA